MADIIELTEEEKKTIAISNAKMWVEVYAASLANRKAAHDAEAVKEANYQADMASFQKSLDDAKAKVAELDK